MAKQKYKPKITVKVKTGDKEVEVGHLDMGEDVVDMDALDNLVDEEFFKPTQELVDRVAAEVEPVDVKFAATLRKKGSLWQLILITLKDNVIVNTEVSEGDVKAIVLQKALHALHNVTEPM